MLSINTFKELKVPHMTLSAGVGVAGCGKSVILKDKEPACHGQIVVTCSVEGLTQEREIV